MLKKKLIIAVILVHLGIGLYSQQSILDSINEMKPNYERIIAKRIKKQFGKIIIRRMRNPQKPNFDCRRPKVRHIYTFTTIHLAYSAGNITCLLPGN